MMHQARMTHEQSRWLRPDAARWVRPDAARFLKSGTRVEDVYPALALKYSPNQPRVPAGNPDGGQWSGSDGNESGGAFPYGNIDLGDISAEIEALQLFSLAPNENERDNLVQLAANDGKPILDAFGEPYYRPGGHHDVQRRDFRSWNLPSETREVFEKATTGSIPRGYTKIDGQLRGHYWDEFHRSYGEATRELSEKFFRDNGIDRSRMTPDQARGLLREIRESQDPRIRDYNATMRALNRIFRMRGGRE